MSNRGGGQRHSRTRKCVHGSSPLQQHSIWGLAGCGILARVCCRTLWCPLIPAPPAAADDHGLFQIESDACPGNFTAWKTDTYQELAPVSKARLGAPLPHAAEQLGCRCHTHSHACLHMHVHRKPADFGLAPFARAADWAVLLGAAQGSGRLLGHQPGTQGLPKRCAAGRAAAACMLVLVPAPLAHHLIARAVSAVAGSVAVAAGLRQPTA